ncbi:endonuclease [Geodermatophilus sabuli]|uniref:Endonuclease n=1 Tax=Geodermatophilus sabuli TaxID=1564158 RepID=A0A7K3W2L1_9ACTN|nr:endonuclease [Geodermatophilus sabuli]
MRIGTVNISSGRSAAGSVLAPAALGAAVAVLDADVLAVQEVDAGQPRSSGADQAAAVADGLDAADWRGAATLTGTPDPFRSWSPAHPALRGPDDGQAGPVYGIALISRLPVLEWSVLGLGAGRARLPMKAPDPRTGGLRWWWIPDEPRIAVAARLEHLTVVATHLSFAPHTSVRQLLRLRRWMATLPGPTVLAGDLNLPGGVPARLLRATPLVRAASFPAADPRVQLDHLLAVGNGLSARDGRAQELAVGDHRALRVTVSPT